MSRKDRYYIDVFNLKNGNHQYTFDIDDEFFSLFSSSLVEKGSGITQVTLEKSDSLINATVEIDIKVELTCDRSLEKFEYPLQRKEVLMFKYGEEEKELDVNVHTITKSTQRIDFGQHIFDYIGLSIPYKKLHPKFVNDDDTEQDELIFQTQSDDEEDTSAEDPRWEALKKLKDKE